MSRFSLGRKACAVDGCSEKVFVRNYCAKHNREMMSEEAPPEIPTESDEPPNVESMNVKEMKTYLTEKGVDISDCFEKSDLKKRIEQVLKGEISIKMTSSSAASPVKDSSPNTLHFPVIKTNSFGMRQRRVLILDRTLQVMKVIDGKNKIKKEFHIDTIHAVKRDASDPRNCSLEFGKPKRNVTIAEAIKAELQKDYHLTFENSKVREEFCTVANDLIQATNKKKKLSVGGDDSAVGLSKAALYRGPGNATKQREEILTWEISKLELTGENEVFVLTWNLTTGKITFRDNLLRDRWIFEHTDLQSVSCYYSLARNIMSKLKFRSLSADIHIMFENKHAADDFVSTSVSMLGELVKTVKLEDSKGEEGKKLPM